MKQLFVSVIIAFTAFAAWPQPLPLPPAQDGWCATSPANTENLRERHEWLKRRDHAAPRVRSTTGILEQNGMFVIEADALNLLNHNPLDLVGRSITIDPEDTGGYRLRGNAATLRDRGVLLTDFGASGELSTTIELPFSFPFFGQIHDRAYLTSRNGIHFTPPSPSALNQYEIFDLASIEEPLISPLLLAAVPRTFVPPRVYLATTDSEVIVTWVTDSTDFGYEVQVRLAESGTVELTWGSTRDVEWGAVVVTPGLEAAQIPMKTILSLHDPELDGGARADLDILNISIERYGNTDLVEVRIGVRGNIRRDLIGEDEFVQYGLGTEAGGQFGVYLARDEKYLYLPGRGWITEPGSLELDGAAIRFLAHDADFGEGIQVALDAWVWDSAAEGIVDSAAGTFSHSHSGEQFDLDMSGLTDHVVNRPVLQAFTLGDMNPHQIWETLRSQYGLDQEEVDAIAIYQNFFTDLVLYAGAYSTVGNPGADGVSTRPGYGTGHQKSPALLHMSKLGYRYNSEEESALHVLNHEFGHRWLYFFEIIENNQRSQALGPLGGHPAQYVHTPAAFDVIGTRNSSAMGGSWFEDLGNGTFKARESLASFGYSWHELYLMGLASVEEVEPWFYIANSQPRLGDAYYPPDGIVVSGTRHDVHIGQLTEAMGPRLPGPEASQKRFQTYFVLLVRELDQVTPEDLAELDQKRRLLSSSIPAATGGRASAATLYGESYPRRRISHRP